MVVPQVERQHDATEEREGPTRGAEPRLERHPAPAEHNGQRPEAHQHREQHRVLEDAQADQPDDQPQHRQRPAQHEQPLDALRIEQRLEHPPRDGFASRTRSDRTFCRATLSRRIEEIRDLGHRFMALPTRRGELLDGLRRDISRLRGSTCCGNFKLPSAERTIRPRPRKPLFGLQPTPARTRNQNRHARGPLTHGDAKVVPTAHVPETLARRFVCQKCEIRQPM